MKIGKFKKIAAIGLALTMAIGLLYTSGTVNAVDSTNPSVNSGIDNKNVVTNKTAEYISEGENTGKYKIRLEAYAKGKVQTGVTKDLDIVLVLDQSGSMAYNFDGESTNDISSRRQYAMKQAVNNFIDSVYANSLGLNSETRVGVVTFGSNSSVLNNLVSIKDSSNYQQLKNSINGLPNSPSGATRVDRGMNLAQDMLSESNDREKVVIVFTDGVPTTSTDFDISVANNAIATAKSMKDTNTKIYSVGIFYGANPEQLYGPTKHSLGWFEINEEPCTGEVGSKWNTSLDSSWFSDVTEQDIPAGNRFLNYISSNFDNTTEIGIVRDNDTILGIGFFGYTINKNFERSSSDFYKTADNANELNNIFEQISEDISSSSIDLGSEAIMTDTLSDYFEFSETNGIEYWTETYNGNNDWTKDSSITGIIPNKNGNKLDVTGFDYSANYVLEEDVDGEPTGKRLVVEFYVEPKDGFIGGNAVPTNNLSQSGIFLENQTVENFTYPKVDVDINYFVESTDLGMHIGDNWNDFENFVLNDEQIEQIAYKTDSSSKDSFKLNEHPYANDFVTITYTIKDGDTEVGKYVINPKDTKGTWTKNSNIDTTKYTETKNFTIEVSVTNNEKEISNDLDNKTQNSSISSPLESTLYIFIPNINTEDDTLFLNDREVNLTDYVTSSADVDWTCNDSKLNENLTELNKIKNTLGNKPTLIYEFKIKDESKINFSPDKIGIYEVDLKVKNGNVDITKYSHFTHDNTLNQCEANPCGNPHYFLKVEAGSITITKSFDNANYDYTDGNPIFIFKVTDDNGNSYYQNVKFEKNDDNDKLVGVIEGLGIGNYQIEELESLRFEESDFGWSYTDGTYTNSTKDIMLNKENRHAYARFTNEVKSSKYDSDNDIIVNEFTRNADGSISWNGKKLSAKE